MKKKKKVAKEESKKADKKKKENKLRYLRYRNLNQELAKFGFDYTPKKAAMGYGMVLLLAVICGMLYKLELPYIAAIGVIGTVLMPTVLLQSMKGIYHTDMFSLVNTYMDQFLYSFKRNKTILSTLEETLSIFDTGAFREVLEKAIAHIQYDTSSEDTEKEALAMIEDFFHCEKVSAIHNFALGAERRGGDVNESISLFSSNRAMWVARVKMLQSEFLTVKRNIIFALVATGLICIVPLYLLGDQMDISGYPISQVSAVVLLGICMVIYVKADKKLCRSWIEKQDDHQNMAEKYLQVKNYDESKEAKKSMMLAIVPAVVFLGMFVYLQEAWVLILGIVITLFFLKQHTIGQNLARKSVARELNKQFPSWLMNIALLLQTDNVQVAIRKSLEDAPDVLQHPLGELVEELEQTPDSIAPYHKFLKEYRNPDIQSAMKILYSLSSGFGGDTNQQISELIDRNNTMLDNAEKLDQEDKIAGMKIFILLPSLFASFKLMIDMGMLLVVFLQNLAI